MIAYVQFYLGDIPQSTIFHYISIDSGQFRMLSQSNVLVPDEDKFFVTINSCQEANWSGTTMTRDSRVFQDGAKGEDSVVISGNDLSRIYSWYVTQGVANAAQKADTKVTFVLDGFLLSKEMAVRATSFQVNDLGQLKKSSVLFGSGRRSGSSLG